jgi:hypothetical protein
VRDKRLDALVASARNGEAPPLLTHKNKDGSSDQPLPALHRSDMKKLLRLPEPRRTSKWIRLSFVACNGNFESFERLYMSYHNVFDPRDAQDTSGQLVVPKHDRTRNKKTQEELAQGKQPHKERPSEKDLQDEPIEEQQSQDAQSKISPAPVVTRLEFLTILSNAIHGVLTYTPQSRVRSWRDEGEPQFSKLVVVGVCPRTQALTFPSTNRERNLRQLQYYKDHNEIIYPEGDPEKMSTFSKWLAHDPLFILPKDTKSTLHQRQMRDEAYYDGKATEDPAFPGVYVNKKKFFVENIAVRHEAGEPVRCPCCSESFSKPGFKTDPGSKDNQDVHKP